MAQGKKVTMSQFKVIRILLDSGETIKEVAEYMEISPETIRRIKNAEDYEDYCNYYQRQSGTYYRRKREAQEAAAMKEAEEREKKREEEPPVQVVEHRQTVTVQATWAMTQEMQKTNKLLELISNKLAFIVDELTGSKGGCSNE